MWFHSYPWNVALWCLEHVCAGEPSLEVHCGHAARVWTAGPSACRHVVRGHTFQNPSETVFNNDLIVHMTYFVRIFPTKLWLLIKNEPTRPKINQLWVFLGSLLPPLPCRQDIEQQLGSLILATDISRQNEFLLTFREHLDHQDLDLQLPSHRHFILQVLCICTCSAPPPTTPPQHSNSDRLCLPTDRSEVCRRL